MQITLQRQVKAVCYQAVANVDVEQTRPDIQKALELAKTDYQRLPLRLVNYLEKEGLLSDEKLTELGEQTCNSGLLASREYGIYNIWYLDNDELLNTRPLLLQRVSEPVNKGYKQTNQFYHWLESEKLVDTDVRNSTSSQILVAGKADCEQKAIQNLTLKVINNGIAKMQVKLTLTLSLVFKRNQENEVSFKLSGELPVKFDGKEKAIAVSNAYSGPLDTGFFHDLSVSTGMQWNAEQQRMYADVPSNIKALTSFVKPEYKLTHIDTCYGEFDTGEIKQMPLMPADDRVAEQWQTSWLNELYKEDYFSEKQALYRQQTWLSHPALKEYKLRVKSGKSLLSVLDRKKSPVSYWHATASHYLIPSATQSPLPSIHFKDKDDLSVSDLLRYLTLSEPVKHIIYSDRHYKSSKHKRNMVEIARLSGAKSGQIYTTAPDVNVPEGWHREVMRSEKDNHDRYWIITTENQQYVWKSSTSLDFVDFTHEQPKVHGNPTFTQLERNYLPDYLQHALAIKQVEVEV